MLLLSFRGEICDEMLYVVNCKLLFLVYIELLLGIDIIWFVLVKINWLCCFRV